MVWVSRTTSETQERAAEDNEKSQREWLGPDPEALGKEPGCESGQPDGGVASELVEPHGAAPFVVARELDSHQHGRRPRESLVDSQQQVGRDDPPPRGRLHQKERHGKTHQPSCDEDASRTEALGQQAGDEVAGGLAKPKLTRKREVASPDESPNSPSARRGIRDRSWPTRGPTSALMPITRAN
jgi:hypothetical protein